MVRRRVEKGRGVRDGSHKCRNGTGNKHVACRGRERESAGGQGNRRGRGSNVGREMEAQRVGEGRGGEVRGALTER